MDADDLIQLARERCAQHLPAKGMCHGCFRAELEEMLLEENPDMQRADAHDLVEEWMLLNEGTTS